MAGMKTPLLTSTLGMLTLIGLLKAPAAIADECWLGERFGIKASSYMVESGGDSSESCRQACAADMGNALKICHRLGAPYINNAEFGCFYRQEDKAAELVTKPPLGFFGCTEICECAEGTWYESFRRRCVAPTGTEVPNMPNGDKGGGYYVKDGYLFKDAEQADCRMLPAGEPMAAKSGAATSEQWTPWMNIDLPGGHGDIEGLNAYIMNGKVCARPIDVQCRTRAGIDWLKAGQVYTCNRYVGGVCTNFTQAEGERCLDYEVRFLCP